MATSSSSSPPKFDVFLNFRGHDTRKRFIGHLYKALKQKAIHAFQDSRELIKGNDISALLKAIEDSRLSIVVFSENYANSIWCLKELVKIEECMDKMGQIVLPIFYEVHPSHISKLEGNFAADFDKHDRNSEIDEEDLKRWKSALTRFSKISGWESSKYEDESELIIEIVEDISRKLIHMSSSKADRLVGMDNHIREMYLRLSLEEKDVRYIAIIGPCGIGKSTIAKATFDKIAGQFDHYCFLEDVGEGFKQSRGGVCLRERLETTILGNCNTGTTRATMERFSKQKVLLVLDGVESLTQIEALRGIQCPFGVGSRIIITTRDIQSLGGVAAYHYRPNFFSSEEARELIVQYAFPTKQPTQEFDSLLRRVIVHAAGLPLVLKVLGIFLYSKTPLEWEDELDKLREFPHQEIQRVLRTSYDGLDPLQRKIFLDIACFFVGMDTGFVTEILERCGFHPIGGLRVLFDRALVCNNLEMHNSLQQMGREIVRQECEEPGGRSRLWSYSDVDAVMLTKNTATKAVECIKLDLSNSSEEVYINAEAFVQMNRLRLFRIYYSHPSDHCKQHVTGDFVFLSHELRCLIWEAYPLKCLPLNFDSENLVYLDMSYSCIEQLWQGTEVHKSITAFKNLEVLRLKDCKELVNLPHSIEMKCLKILDLSGCSNLKKFPEISVMMKKLLEVYLDETAIKELPSSITLLQGICILSMRNCRSLVSLPDAIGNLGCLTDLDLSGCSMLNHLPESLGNLDSLKIEVKGCGIKELPVSMSHMKKPKILSIDGCKEMRAPFSPSSFSQSHHGSCEPLLATTSKREKEKGGMKNGSLLAYGRKCCKFLFFILEHLNHSDSFIRCNT